MELRQIKREDNDDLWDPIYLSNMEFDDQCITKKEERYLLEDTLWQDIHKCFEVNDDRCSRKREVQIYIKLKFSLLYCE